MSTSDGLLRRLAGLDRHQLAKVLANRPDALAPPWPRRLEGLAARLSSHLSLAEASLALSTPQAQVLRAVQLCQVLGPEPTPPADVARWLGTEPSVVESIVDGLAELAFAWTTDGGIELPEPLQSDSYSIYGLGRPVDVLFRDTTMADLAQLAKGFGLPSTGRKRELSERLLAFFRDGDRVRKLVGKAPEATRALLAEIALDGPERHGLVQYGRPLPGSPAAWALDRGLLFGTYDGSAYMPLEVSLALRGPGYKLPFTPDEPECPTTEVGVDAVEASASAAALRLLDRVSTILDLAAESLPLLKNGTVGTRLVKKIAKDTGGTPEEIELAIDLAVRCELLVVEEPEPVRKPRRGKAPTPAAPKLVLNEEIARPGPALLYRFLLSNWWDAPAPEYEEPDSIGDQVRRLVLRLLTRLAPGTGVLDVAALTRLVGWHAPTVPPEAIADTLPAALVECELLGLVSSGSASSVGRALLEADAAALIKATDELVSRARTTALFGTDLTAIVPGSPDARLAALLDRAADRENQGTATSWRFSPASVRRAFDQGATAETLLDELGSVAAGELPQPLVYLVNDVARRHGEAQVLPVASVVVGTDPAVLTEIAAHRKLAKLGLRAVAPTVLTSTVDARGTLDALREAGYAPTRHAADGSLVVPGREQTEPISTVRDPEPEELDVPPLDPLEHADRLLAAPASGGGLVRGRLAKAMSDRLRGRLTPAQQQLCWQLEAGIPAQVRYRDETGETKELVIVFPEVDGNVVEAWSLGDVDYRRLELDRLELG